MGTDLPPCPFGDVDSLVLGLFHRGQALFTQVSFHYSHEAWGSNSSKPPSLHCFMYTGVTMWW